MQYGVLVTSTSRTGSQQPIDNPGIGTFALVHRHKGDLGLALSRFLGDMPLPIENPPIEIGMIQLQQTSVIGLTKCPLQVTLAIADVGIVMAINSTIIY
jgi:hypothetical protein